MDRDAERSSAFWDELERDVTRRVQEAFRYGGDRRARLLAYLRDVETLALAEGDRRQTVQIIASGRSLLGDRRQLGPSGRPLDRIPRAPLHRPSGTP